MMSMSGKSLYELLEAVNDLPSFMAFVAALAAEREAAEQLEREEPARYQLGGALGWQNGSISTYLEAALAYFEDSGWAESSERPTWRDLAQFLYMGKIYE